MLSNPYVGGESFPILPNPAEPSPLSKGPCFRFRHRMRLFHLHSTVKIRTFSPFSAGGPPAVADCWSSLWNVEKASAISHGLILSNPCVFRFFCRGRRCAAPPFPWGRDRIVPNNPTLFAWTGGPQRSLFFSYCGPMTFIYSTAEKNSMIRPRMNAWSKLDISAMSPPRSTAAPMPTSHAMR